MKQLELIYDDDCPNVSAAREALLQALTQLGLPVAWTEWNRAAPESPAYVRAYGSPTILLDGEDLAGAQPEANAAYCRVYRDSASGFRGAPSTAEILDAITPSAGSSWPSLFAALPGIGASLLPVGVCPACWPAYAGMLSALGLGFLLEGRYLLPFIGALFTLALLALGWRAPSRRGYRPLLLGSIGSALALVGKFAWASDSLLYLGIAVLFGASLWNSWPRSAATGGSCAACAPENLPPTHRAHEMESQP